MGKNSRLKQGRKMMRIRAKELGGFGNLAKLKEEVAPGVWRTDQKDEDFDRVWAPVYSSKEVGDETHYRRIGPFKDARLWAYGGEVKPGSGKKAPPRDVELTGVDLGQRTITLKVGQFLLVGDELSFNRG